MNHRTRLTGHNCGAAGWTLGCVQKTPQERPAKGEWGKTSTAIAKFHCPGAIRTNKKKKAPKRLLRWVISLTKSAYERGCDSSYTFFIRSVVTWV